MSPAHLLGMDAGPATVALIAAAFAIGGTLKGATGFGMPLVVVTVLASAVPAPVALALMVVPAFLLNIWQMGRWPTIRTVLGLFWPVLLGIVAGTALGAGIAASIDAVVLRRIIGAITVSFAAVVLSGWKPPYRPQRRRGLGMATGTVSGLAGSLTTVNGPPLIMFLLSMRVDPDLFRASLGLFFLVASVALAAAFSGIGFLTPGRAAASLLCIVPAAAGMWLGRRLAGRIDAAALERLILVALIGLGLSLLVR